MRDNTNIKHAGMQWIQAGALILALTVGSAHAGAVQSEAFAPSAPRSVVERFQTAWNNGNAAAVAQLFTPSGNLALPNGDRAGTQAAIKDLITEEFQDIFRGSTLTLGIDSLRWVEGGTAVVHGSYELSGIDALAFFEVSRAGSFAARLQERGGAWQIASAEFARN